MGDCGIELIISDTNITRGIKIIISDTNITQLEFEEILKQNPNITELDCDNCTNLTSIPQLDKLKVLYCRDCTGLTNIPKLDKLEILGCFGCVNLTSVPQLDKLTYLCFFGCTNLTENNIGYLPKLAQCEAQCTIDFIDFINFKSRNKDINNLKLASVPILKILESKNCGGFHRDFMSCVAKMIL